MFNLQRNIDTAEARITHCWPQLESPGAEFVAEEAICPVEKSAAWSEAVSVKNLWRSLSIQRMLISLP
jgi:hypothetical protein